MTLLKTLKSQKEISIVAILIGICLLFELIGWFVVGQSFLGSPQRLFLMILQVAVIGTIAIGVTQVIITGGIDLSSGSVVALTAVVAASLAQAPTARRIMYEGLNLPFFAPLLVGIAVGALCGYINGFFVAKVKIPSFIATLGMMVAARGMAQFYTQGKPVSMLKSEYLFWGRGITPVVVYLTIGLIAHIMLSHTKYGKYIYAIGGNEQAAIVSGIDVAKYKIRVYVFAGILSGLAGIILSARVNSGQSGMGMSFELDAIAAAVIGGTSLSGGIGRIPGTIIGALVLGVIKSGFSFLRIDAYIQEIIKGAIIVGAVVLDVMRNKNKA